MKFSKPTIYFSSINVTIQSIYLKIERVGWDLDKKQKFHLLKCNVKICIKFYAQSRPLYLVRLIKNESF